MDEDLTEEVDFHDELHKHEHDFLGLFETMSLHEKLQKVFYGLKQPRDSGAHKYAKLQMIRLMSPFAAVLVPMLALLLLIVFAGMAPPPSREVQVRIMEPEAIEDLDEIEELMDEPLEPPEPVDMDFTTPDINITDTTVAPTPQTDFSPTPATFESVSIVRSPVIMRGIYGSRSGGARGSALAAYGGSGITEGAVLRALRWLKKNQLPDGSWPPQKPAMTALALLSFLAHGETPASEEFGPTVEKAIKHLVDTRDKAGGWPRRYQHAIVTYALCEAFALTRVPMLREVCDGAVDIVIKGQNVTGGFDYPLNGKTARDDTSVMGWCAQSLKAAKMAGIEHPQLKDCMKKAIEGFRGNYKGTSEAGGFGYTGPQVGGLTGVGVLCMQLLGEPNAKEVKASLATLDKATFIWGPGGFHNKNYYWYYITQAKFHAGGSRWKSWNNLFAPVLVKNQVIIKDGIMGPKGEMVDIGYWNIPKELAGHGASDVMNTTLCALQLQVYYRYLPTFKTPRAIEEVEELVGDDGDVDIQITI